MVNWRSWAEAFFGLAIIDFIGAEIYSFWAVKWINFENIESVILYYLVDLSHFVALVALPLLAAIVCALFDMGEQMRKRDQG